MSEPGRLLVAIGGAALVGAVVFRAIANALDLSPIVAILILWAVLTLAWVAFSLLRARRDEDEDPPG